MAILRAGNGRFAQGAPQGGDLHAERAEAAGRHAPAAVVIACADARVPVEAVFDQPAGALFVVRTAGNSPDAAGWASARFGVQVLGARLVVVLGHSDCGAVRAVVEGGAPAWLDPVLDRVRESLTPASDGSERSVDQAIRDNVMHVARRARRMLEEAGFGDGDEYVVVGGVYSLDTGRIEWVDEGAAT